MVVSLIFFSFLFLFFFCLAVSLIPKACFDDICFRKKNNGAEKIASLFKRIQNENAREGMWVNPIFEQRPLEVKKRSEWPTIIGCGQQYPFSVDGMAARYGRIID